ncbi:MAG: selenide, water dikinase SelD, partial [Pseudomonadota bacterium]
QALKKGVLSAEGYAQMIATTTQLNTAGGALSELQSVHALTDITGFGLLGHLLEICRGSNLSAEINFNDIPVLSHALPLAQQGYGPGAIERNMESYGHAMDFAAQMESWQQRLLADPQTSGGLLVSVAAQAVDEVLVCFRDAGFAQASVIGSMREGSPTIKVTV